MVIQFKVPAGKVPERRTSGAAGFDLFTRQRQMLRPGDRATFDTGVFAAIPPGYVGLIKPRSGLAVRLGLDTLAGVIDEDYRGEIKVVLINHGSESVYVTENLAIAQLVVIPYLSSAAVVDTLDETERNENGFGHTDK